jgi:MATE family multidrug resistance protein
MEEHKLHSSLLQNANDEEDFSLDFTGRFWAESKCLWRIAAGAFVGALANIGSSVITHAFVGRIGNLELAAFSLVTGVLIPSISIILAGMANVIETVCGQAFGAKKHSMLGIYLQRSWIVVLGLAALLLPSFIFTVPILRFLGQPEDIAELSGRAVLWCIPLYLSMPFSCTMGGYLSSQSKNMIVAGSAAVGTVITALLNWIWILNWNMGLWGALVSLNIGCWVPPILSFFYISCGGCPFTWTGFSMEAFCELWPFLKLSVASGAMLCLDFLYYRILVLMTGQLKDPEIILDSLSICLAICTLEMSIPLGFLVATSVRVANQLGAGNPAGAKFSIFVSLASSFIVGIIMSVVILVFRSQLGYLFTNSKSVQHAVAKLGSLLAFTVVLNSIQRVLVGVAIGSGRQARVVSVNLVCYYLIGVPFGMLLCFQFYMGIQGIWIGLLWGNTIQIIVLACIIWRMNWD